MRITPDESRRAIVQAAQAMFCERGYGVATLEQIGAQVGLTRGGVLHHFASKADLLRAVIDPYRRALADLLTNTQVDDPPSAGQRRQLLSSFADLMLEHRGGLRLLANDVSARAQLGLEDQWPFPEARVVRLLVGSTDTELTPVRAIAALGAIIQPVASVWLDLGDAATRDELIDAAVAVIDGPRSVTSRPRTQGSSAPTKRGRVPRVKAAAR